MEVAFKATFTEQESFKTTMNEGETLDTDFGEVSKVSTTDYNELFHKPQINGVELKGNKTFDDLGDHTMTNAEIKAMFDRIFGGN